MNLYIKYIYYSFIFFVKPGYTTYKLKKTPYLTFDVIRQ